MVPSLCLCVIVTAAGVGQTADRERFRIDADAEMFRQVRDDAYFPWTAPGPRDLAEAAGDEMEERAYDAVLLRARAFPAADLLANARRDVAYQDLVQKGRLSFKLELVAFDGRLRRLRRVEPRPALAAAGVTDVYEAWVFPPGESSPLCVFLTELPAGVAPQTDLRVSAPAPWVSVAGYSFKLLRYEAAKTDARDPDRHEVRRAPVLIGRSLEVLAEPPETDGGAAWRETFLPVVIAGFSGVAAVIVGLGWYFRRGDRAVRQTMTGERPNPFAGG